MLPWKISEVWRRRRRRRRKKKEKKRRRRRRRSKQRTGSQESCICLVLWKSAQLYIVLLAPKSLNAESNFSIGSQRPGEFAPMCCEVQLCGSLAFFERDVNTSHVERMHLPHSCWSQEWQVNCSVVWLEWCKKFYSWFTPQPWCTIRCKLVQKTDNDQCGFFSGDVLGSCLKLVIVRCHAP